MTVLWKNRKFILKNAVNDLRHRYAGATLGVFGNVLNPAVGRQIASDAIVNKLLRVIDCRDPSLDAIHGLLARRTLEKENEIHKMVKPLAENEKVIVTLASNLSDKKEETARKEVEIRRLALAASERLDLINRQHAELESIGRSSEYRLGDLALSPWQVLKKRLCRNMIFR